MASPTVGWAQEVPAPSGASSATETAPPSGKTLLKIGLDVARFGRWGGFDGTTFRVPVTVSAERWLSSKFTLYSQLNADFAARESVPYTDEHTSLIPTGALSVGGRYYYNQAGRARRNRPHEAFVGNYLAAELRTETGYRFGTGDLSVMTGYTFRREFAPTLNLMWGLQRHLNRSFLFDASAGVGIGARRSDLSFGGFSSGPVNLSGQLNLGIYFGR